MNQVYFTDKPEKVAQIAKEQFKQIFKWGETVAIKLHMGEPGNKYFLKPETIKPIVSTLLSIGCKPFLFDSPVQYKGNRDTEEKYLKSAQKHGFDTLGIPIIVSNEAKTVKMPHLNAEVCKPLIEADGVLILSHVKGHFCCGFGGAIKNLGMGALTKKTKGDIHKGGEPVYTDGCILCGKCAKVCPTNNIRYADKRPYFDESWCCGCSNCALYCPERAIKPKVAPFDALLAEGAFAALKSFKKYYCINYILQVAQNCDCWSGDNKIISPDIGIVLGKDIVAVERASADLIKEQHGKDIFEELSFKSPLVHIREAEKLGMGKQVYTLVRQ
jgi:uncharacterized Fe-S center protein